MTDFKIHWKAPLQSKGFIKIIEFFLAILTFSLVAGFLINAHVSCQNVGEVATVPMRYPFSTISFKNRSVQMNLDFPITSMNGASQLMVAWGVLTMIYCIAAMAVYMLFTANERLEKVMDWLVYSDLAFNIAWVLCWFIASVEWTVAFHAMERDVPTKVFPLLSSSYSCQSGSPQFSQDTYQQAAVASVFGFVNVFLWGANIYWVFIDTAFFIKWRANRQMNYNNM